LKCNIKTKRSFVEQITEIFRHFVQKPRIRCTHFVHGATMEYLKAKAYGR